MRRIQFLIEDDLAKDFKKKLIEHDLTIQDCGTLMVEKYLSEETDSFGIPVEEDFPKPTLKEVEKFWSNDGPFFQMAEHLMKIAMFPKHRDQRSWRDSVLKQLVLIIRKIGVRSNKYGDEKSHVKHMEKTTNQLTARIDDMVFSAFDKMMMKMSPSKHERDGTISDFDTIRDLGFKIEEYFDGKYGYNLRVVRNGEVIADSISRKRG